MPTESCASVKMDWEPSGNIETTGVTQNSADDSVVILDNSPLGKSRKNNVGVGKDKNGSVSIVHEVVVISDAEENSPSPLRRKRISERISSTRRESVLLKSEFEENDVICVSSSVPPGQRKRKRGRKPQQNTSPKSSNSSPASRKKRKCLMPGNTPRVRGNTGLRNVPGGPSTIPTNGQTYGNASRAAKSRTPFRRKKSIKNRGKEKPVPGTSGLMSRANVKKPVLSGVDLHIMSVKPGTRKVEMGNNLFQNSVCRFPSNAPFLQNKENNTCLSENCSPLCRNIMPTSKKLRPIVIDGSNVAYTHGKSKTFSCKGIEICVQYFQNRGHEVTAFVPQFRRCKSKEIVGQDILERLGERQIVVFTPSRMVEGVLINSYDDRFILDFAVKTGGVIVSNDNYRDIKNEKPEWRHVVNERLLMYLFVGDIFMVPDDPLGRRGITLDMLLSF